MLYENNIILLIIYIYSTKSVNSVIYIQKYIFLIHTNLLHKLLYTNYKIEFKTIYIFFFFTYLLQHNNVKS